MNHDQKATGPASGTPAAIKWIMAAVAGWGLLLAAGAYFYVDPAVMRIRPAAAAVIVLACTGGFVVVWWLLLAVRRRQEIRRSRPYPDNDEAGRDPQAPGEPS